MSVKTKTLKKLEENRGIAISGQQLAESLGVSRTAVWKAINALKDEGFSITGTPKKGYVLSDKSSKLSEESIVSALREFRIDEQIAVHYFNEIDSTNAEAKRYLATADKGEIPFGHVFIADKQTAGRGRRKRFFFSPNADSIYISCILRPSEMIEQSLMITIAAAVAVCKVIEKMSDCQCPKIKWVNDVFIGENKVCGILTEAISDIENGEIESLVLGIGININVPKEEFSEEIRDIAGSVSIDPGRRSEVAAALIDEIFSDTGSLANADVIDEYRSRSMMTNRKITVTKNDIQIDATALGINDDGSLKVRYENGTVDNLKSGEVSILLNS